MLDIEFIKENPDKVKKGAKLKGYDANKLVDDVIALDKKRRNLIVVTEDLRARRNELSKNIKGKPDEKTAQNVRTLKDDLAKKENELKKIETELREKLLSIPNPPLDSVLIGKSDKENKPIRNVGKVPKFSFPIKDHVELGKALNIIDMERGVKAGGTRSYILKNELVVLEQSLLRYAIDLVRSRGFEIMNVPVLVKEEVLVGAGFFPFGKDDVYRVNEDDKYLVGTSEASLVYYHSQEVLKEKALPRLMSGITACFRKEAGTYGKDTQGVIRVHQFNKVEQVALCKGDDWEQAFNLILGVSEELVKSLGLAYQIVEICTGDLGAKNAKQLDLEVWFPSQEKYRETHSCSYLTDYQGRRSNIRYETKDGKKEFVHTLNNTAIATPRILAAIIETYQQKDGTIEVPKVLQKYTGFAKIGKKA